LDDWLDVGALFVRWLFVISPRAPRLDIVEVVEDVSSVCFDGTEPGFPAAAAAARERVA
jgi:hypothetical protein